MHKNFTFLTALMLAIAFSSHVQADGLKIGKNLSIDQNTEGKALSIQDVIEMNSKPYNDVKISNDVSAGIISGRDDFTMENKERMPAKKKGNEVGVGISLSF